MKNSQYVGEGWKHAILIIGALVVLLPFYMVVSISLKSQQEIQSISGGLNWSSRSTNISSVYKNGNVRRNMYDETLCFTIIGLLLRKHL